jgi:hypothetical protein
MCYSWPVGGEPLLAESETGTRFWTHLIKNAPRSLMSVRAYLSIEIERVDGIAVS